MKRLIAAGVIAFALLASPSAALAQQSGVTPGAFCSPEGASGTTTTGTPMLCARQGGETQARWHEASGAVTSPSGVVVATQAATQVQALSTQPATFPRTGVLSVRVAAFGVLLVAFGWVFVSAVRPRWRHALTAPESVLGAWRGPRFTDRRTSSPRRR
jgi:hypothetical protein